MALVRVNEQGRRIGETHRNARHSDADVERAIAAYEVLQSYAKVAAAMGAKKSTVLDWIKGNRRGQVGPRTSERDPNYYGFPGGRPVWPFARTPKKPKPEPVTLPTMRRGVAILQLVAAGADTNRAVASRLGMKLTDSVAGPIAALDREGYIARTRNDGRSDRVLSLTDRGRRALEIANAG